MHQFTATDDILWIFLLQNDIDQIFLVCVVFQNIVLKYDLVSCEEEQGHTFESQLAECEFCSKLKISALTFEVQQSRFCSYQSFQTSCVDGVSLSSVSSMQPNAHFPMKTPACGSIDIKRCLYKFLSLFPSSQLLSLPQSIQRTTAGY